VRQARLGLQTFAAIAGHAGIMMKPVLAAAAMLLAIPAARASDYRAYAQAIAAAPPEGTIFRDDLEALLDAAASDYRKSKHRRALAASPLLETAARAQALDTMASGRSGHLSRNGQGFDVRFRAFQPDPAKKYGSGENAASDRRRGDADGPKAMRLFKLWVDSSGHRENLLNERYKFVSSGVVQRGSELWAVQIFWSDPKTGGGLFQ
jgi:uncharacterized protein YkwD